MSDPQDRRMADLFELELRRKADLDSSNAWELIWFLGLPLETRRSYMRILEARIDQDSTRQYLFRQSCYRKRNWREPAVPCMHLDTVSGPPRPWVSLGRRRRRRSVKRYRFASRRSHQPTCESHEEAEVFDPPPKPEPEPEPEPIDDPSTPPRPPTPEGLRDALHEKISLAYHALGRSESQYDSPRVPTTPSEVPEYPPFPLYPSEPLVVNGKRRPNLLPFIVAAGRHYVSPWQNYSLAEASDAIEDLSADVPGVFTQLIRILFPTGFEDMRAAMLISIHASVILDFMRGWSIIPEAWAKGRMPNPEPLYLRPRCARCGV
ncbi:hypothetical protein FS749_007218 [Ceratobasidium sp. UAMH 11750]|nr:hypothetical protein FS749_007218 [Ceratobasidium sp. UAMH 11750]